MLEHPQPRATQPREPFSPTLFPAWDGRGLIEDYRFRRDREYRRQRVEWLRAGPMAQAVDADGRPLYRINNRGQWTRTAPLSRSTRRRVLARDGHACTQCGSTRDLEVDHVVRYIDGGSNDPSNLRTLCATCHRRRRVGDRP